MLGPGLPNTEKEPEKGKHPFRKMNTPQAVFTDHPAGDAGLPHSASLGTGGLTA